MFWIIAVLIVAFSLVGPILWSVFVHPIRSAITVLKLVLGLSGIAYLLSGFVLDDMASGVIGVGLLIGASMISALQPRRI